MRRALRCASWLASAGIIWLGLGGQVVAEGRPVTVQVPLDPGSLDPHMSSGSWGRQVSRFAYDTLLGLTPDNRIVSQLASSWEATPTRIVLTLREDVSCSDGSKLTPSVVAANFARLKDPAMKAPYTASFMGSVNFTVSADDAANTVTIDLPEPFSPLLSNLTYYPQIICQAGLDNPTLLQQRSVGTGAWILTTAEAGNLYHFAPREGYAWGPDGMATDPDTVPSELTVQVVANETTAANLFLAGDLDVALFNTPAGDRVAEGIATVQAVPSINTVMQFNFTRPANLLNSIELRRALMGYLNRQELSIVATGKPQLSNSVALPQAECGETLKGQNIVSYDPAASDALLTSLGWQRNNAGVWQKDGQPLSVAFLVTGNAGDPNRPAGAYVYDVWRKAGIDVSLQTADEKTGFDIRRSGEWDVLLVGWNSVFNPAIISPFYISPTSATYTYLANDDYVEATRAAYATVPADSCPIWNRAQEAIDRQISAVPMYYSTTRFTAAQDVEFRISRGFLLPESIRMAK